PGSLARRPRARGLEVIRRLRSGSRSCESRLRGRWRRIDSGAEMYSWLAKAIMRRNLARLNEGDYQPTLRLDAPDGRFRLPGDSSWATAIEGCWVLGRWLQRFLD